MCRTVRGTPFRAPRTKAPTGLAVELVDLRAVERNVADQTLLAEDETQNGSLQGLGVVSAAGTLLQHGDAGISADRPTVAGGEFIQYFLRHEQNDFFVFCQAERQADRSRRDAVVGNILAIDTQCALAELTADADAAFGDARKHQHAFGAADQFSMCRIELIKLLHRDVHTLIDLSLGGSE